MGVTVVNRELAIGSEMRKERRPLARCDRCLQRTPHRYERVGVNGQLTSRAVCLVCNHDSRSERTGLAANGPSL